MNLNIDDALDILGVPKGASVDEIKRAYRRLVLKYHPDVNSSPFAVEKFKAINKAYRIALEYAKILSQQSISRPKKTPSFFSKIKKAVKEASTFVDRLLIYIGRAPTLNFDKGVIKIEIDKTLLSLPYQELETRYIYSNNKYVKLEALKAMIVGYGHQAYRQVIKALDSSIPEIRHLAIRGVGYLGISQAGPKLLEIWVKASHNEKKLILQTMRHINVRGIEEILIDAIANPDDEIKIEALKTIIISKAYHLEKYILNLMKNDNPTIKNLALFISYQAKRQRSFKY